MNRISILGSGWLGLPLAQALVKQGFAVNASTRSTARFGEIKASGAHPFIVDIHQTDATIDDFLRADLLIVNITSKDLSAFRNLLPKIEQSTLSRVIFISSTSVYQNTNNWVTELDDAIDSNHPLYQIEQLFLSCSSFATTVIRFAGLIGYNRHPGRFFAHKPVPQPDAPVNLIHRDDCIAIIMQLIRENVRNEVFNACADTHPSKREFYTYARQQLGLPPPTMQESGHLAYKIVSNSKLKDRLCYQYKVSDLMSAEL